MNRYINALSVLANLTDGMCRKSIHYFWEGNVYQNEIDTLKELVDKEKPMKPIFEKESSSEYVYVCPKCNERVRTIRYWKGDFYHYHEDSGQNNYCSECGQKLDWSNKEVSEECQKD